jgi:hypothetical protein
VTSVVVVNKLTKASHFVAVKSTHKKTNIAEIYMREVAKLHGVPKNFFSNRDSKFTSKFWKGLFKVLAVGRSGKERVHKEE